MTEARFFWGKGTRTKAVPNHRNNRLVCMLLRRRREQHAEGYACVGLVYTCCSNHPSIAHSPFAAEKTRGRHSKLSYISKTLTRLLPRTCCESPSGETKAATKLKHQKKLSKQERQTNGRLAGFFVTWASLSRTMTLSLAWQTKRIAQGAGGPKCGF